MDIPRCTDVSRPFPTPESRASILVGQSQEVTLLKKGKHDGMQPKGKGRRFKPSQAVWNGLRTLLYIGSEARPNVDPIPGNTPEKPANEDTTGSFQRETNTLKQKKPHWAAFSIPEKPTGIVQGL
ncbi:MULTISPECIES: hypothetical protein [unclassified Pseudomonas]|uniref:hypothetical protein n=1 Tax=unclassified Pseudomonas TaxID=196821 RepID=UPI00384D111E